MALIVSVKVKRVLRSSHGSSTVQMPFRVLKSAPLTLTQELPLTAFALGGPTEEVAGTHLWYYLNTPNSPEPAYRAHVDIEFHWLFSSKALALKAFPP